MIRRNTLKVVFVPLPGPLGRDPDSWPQMNLSLERIYVCVKIQYADQNLLIIVSVLIKPNLGIHQDFKAQVYIYKHTGSW